jgi:hypothetical protein
MSAMGSKADKGLSGQLLDLNGGELWITHLNGRIWKARANVMS